jgi:tRNA threonylcarbamoyladenosine biosynthesis protein TsaE
MIISIFLQDLVALQNLAKEIAQRLNCGDIITLMGDLGVGKTEFARALIRTLTHTKQTVPSPTFTLLQTYESFLCPIYHFDLYRLEDPDEVHELGLEEALNEGVTLIEWPERMGNILFKCVLGIHIKVGRNDDQREVILKLSRSWKNRLKDLQI